MSRHDAPPCPAAKRSTATFSYDEAVTQRFPAIRAGLLHATGLRNGPTPTALLEAYRAEQQEVAQRLHGTPLSTLPSIAAWRRAFTGFCATPTQHRCAAEALLRRLTKHGDVPWISTLVDIGNLVSIRHALPVAALDVAGIAGATTVRFATGSEPFTELGATTSVHPRPGEVIFVDEQDVVSVRRWCWRQSAQSATSATTIEALMIVEGQHDTADPDVDTALADLASLIAAYQSGATAATQLLSASNPRLPW